MGEIDIEVLGKDTTKVQFNYYTNGVGNHEYMYDLGFDASEGFHTYGLIGSRIISHGMLTEKQFIRHIIISLQLPEES